MLVLSVGDQSMKISFKKATRRFWGGIFASAVLLASFQNCGKAGFDSSLDEGDAGAASSDAALSSKYGQSIGALVSSAPFAFEAGLDQITYNSCADSALTANRKGFYSIKAGAYENMGLGLSSNFFTYVDQNFKPDYGSSVITQAQFQNYLADSPANRDAIANLAIRSKSDLIKVYPLSGTGGTIALGQDVSTMVGNLTTAEAMDPFTIRNSGYIRYFPFSSELKVFESTLTFNTDETLAQAFRNLLVGDGVLALTYLKEKANPNLIRGGSDANPMKAAYGRGYRFSYSQPPKVNATSSRVIPSNVLASITEVDLSSGQAVYNWNCGRRYIVVRSQDQATLCPALTYAQMQTATVLRELEIARRQLSADSWDVNPLLGCVVPKGQISCYNEEQNNGSVAGVNYWPEGDKTAAAGSPESKGECFNELLQAGNYSTTKIPTKRCAHYVTICTRFNQ